MKTTINLLIALTLITLPLATQAQNTTPSADEIIVTAQLKGVEARKGSINCAIYKPNTGFPMNPAKALATTKAIKKDNKHLCIFRLAAPGSYAISVLHDENGNNRVDTNFVGIPQEGWASSNNVKPAFRAPTFEESRVNVTRSMTLSLQLHY